MRCLAVARKVTEEMLLGDWECTQNDQKAKWKNGTFQDFGEIKSEKALITYKTYDGLLMRGRVMILLREIGILSHQIFRFKT